MIDVLAPLFRGDFETYREVLVLDDDPRPATPYHTLMAPSAKACASKAAAPHKASAAAVAKTPVLHGCRAMPS